ncbi:MAG: reverse transcriptase domain-containing protein, partial [Desulfosudaceae bacterium]
MPKTTGDLWQQVISWETLYNSYLEARKGHKFKQEVLDFGSSLEENLTNIHNHLIYKSWEPGPWRQFWVYDPKSRLIQAPPFKDRVVHHALVDTIEPLFERKMIYDSYACRLNKGVHRASARVQQQLRQARRNHGRIYVLQADISKYFPSINHDTLLAVLARTVRDKDVLWLCEQIIRQSGY